MDQVSTNVSALLAGRRNKIILAVTLGACILIIVSVSKASSAHHPQDRKVVYRRCNDTDAVNVTSFEAEGCKPTSNGDCGARIAQKIAVTIGFEPKKFIENFGLYRWRKKLGEWIYEDQVPCVKGTNCPSEAGSSLTFTSDWNVWSDANGESTDYRLYFGTQLDHWKGGSYMCLEFTVDFD